MPTSYLQGLGLGTIRDRAERVATTQEAGSSSFLPRSTSVTVTSMERGFGSAASTKQMIEDRHVSHLGDVAVPGAGSTALPIREQFRCRRFWFFYHDLRAFTTSVSAFLLAGL